MTTLPTEDWTDKKKGALTQAQWAILVARIPKMYHDNPYHKLPKNELPLQIVALNDFLVDHPGMDSFPAVLYSSYTELSFWS